MFVKNLIFISLSLGLLSTGVMAQDLSNPFSLDEDTPKLDVTEELKSEGTSATSPSEETEISSPGTGKSLETSAPKTSESEPAPEKLEPTVPRLSSPVIDQAGILNSSQVSEIDQKIRSIYKQGGPQIQILILKNLEGFPIEEYSIKVAEAWKIGKKDKGNGVIILMSQEDREVRIEVGEGAEGDLTDVESHQIIQYGMIPEFRKGDFSAGFEAAVDTIAAEFGIQAYEGRNLTPPKDLAKIRRSKKQMVSLMLPIMIFFITFPFLAKLFFKNPILRSVAGAAYMGGLTYFMVGQIFFIILAVVFGFFIGLIGPLNFLMVMLSNSGRGSYYGRGGGLGGGGGWSGGGGGFSGGGASGRW